MSILLKPIGVIHSPFTDPGSMPIQPISENSAAGTIDVFPEFAAGLKDLDGTPLLDIKPHVPEFDCAPGARIGWLEKAVAQMRTKVADDRFH